ncbi:ExbD/TolR family protein [Marinobacter sp. SS21]|uniref:ExbD/TolR family protein n=1 Tax=Marinobacter sp. SS21 TaxID=2979460 RepID=UPI00232DE318|nr:biopolymer transporter ExbD [Marinobacter sp. SS21]MDC0661130.1 biopolymer transporter ExbD [Marinobacter sp. SS21]
MQLVEPRPSRPTPIRITPLIDVVFILLVFFMLTSRLLPTGYLELDNDSGKGQAMADQPRPELVLDDSGTVQWQQRPWVLSALVAELKRLGHTDVNLASDGQTRLTSFTETFTTLQSAGINTHWQRETGAAASD